MMTSFQMYAGRFDLSGADRLPTGGPMYVDALTYLQGTGDAPPEDTRTGVVLVFEEQIGHLRGATRAEIRMEPETARALLDKLGGLLDRLNRGTLGPDDDLDVVLYGPDDDLLADS